MSENIIAVIVGGIIASIFPVINMLTENTRWKKREKIRFLEHKKEELLKLSKKYEEILEDSMQKNELDSDLVSDFLLRFPKNVSDAFIKMLTEKNKEKLRDHAIKIKFEIRKSIVKIDKQINDEFD